MQDIRTFHPRRGRMSPTQLDALVRLGPTYDLPSGPLDAATLFDGRPVALEIGFGLGDATIEMAQADPGTGIVAVDVHTPGVARLLLAVESLALDNVRVVLGDAVELLRDRIPESSLVAIRVFFPDPWPKARHHKRRLIQAPLVALLASRLGSGGYIHCATDWENYAEQMLAVLSAEPLLENTADGFAPRPDYRPLTKFEQRGLKLGHGVWDVIFRRRPESPKLL
jgi:tRNA (guanine-N7-)-methyltransferase